MLALQDSQVGIGHLAWILAPLLGLAAVAAVTLCIVRLVLRSRRTAATSTGDAGAVIPADPLGLVRRVCLAISGLGLILYLGSNDLEGLTAALFVVFGAVYLELALLSLRCRP